MVVRSLAVVSVDVVTGSFTKGCLVICGFGSWLRLRFFWLDDHWRSWLRFRGCFLFLLFFLLLIYFHIDWHGDCWISVIGVVGAACLKTGAIIIVQSVVVLLADALWASCRVWDGCIVSAVVWWEGDAIVVEARTSLFIKRIFEEAELWEVQLVALFRATDSSNSERRWTQFELFSVSRLADAVTEVKRGFEIAS